MWLEGFVVPSLLSLVSVGATYTSVHQAGYCAFYEDCGRNPEVSGSLIPARVPCLYNGPAKRVTGSAHLQLLRRVCPMLVGPEVPLACCSARQLEMLEKSLAMSKPLLSRCPSCVDNFVNLYCQNTCSPDQSVHINVTRAFRANVSGLLIDAVLEYQCYYSSRFAEGSYNSCRNVRIPSTGGYAISPMCGKYGAALCNAERWLRFQGDSSNGLAPLDIHFVLVPPISNGSTPGPGPGGGIVPYDGAFHRCDQPSGPGGQACSCLDCVESCPALPPPPPPPGPWMLGQMDGPLALGLILFTGAVLLFACLLFLLRQWPGGHEKNEAPKVTCTGPPPSTSTQQKLSWVFQVWGTAVARHPVPVLLASCAAVAVLSCGLVFVKLTTDPVELWSAPDSQARSEKAFHDAQFGPFFRTNQIIVTAGPDGRPGYTYDSVFFGPTAFSGLFASKELLLQLLDLQTRLQAISVWSETARRNITLKDICYAPLNPDSPGPTDCAVNSLLQYFQNNRSLIDTVANQTMAGVTGTVDWRDHFLYCINSPLSFKDSTELGMSCMADYGAPVFPFLAVGGYEGEDFSKAEAFIMTFSLNNYPPGDPKHEFVLLWEREYLKILQDYKHNKSINFSIVYMSERSLEDEINRTTAEDIPIFAISYLVIFIYIALALGEYTSWRTIMVDSKVTLGLGGILVVLGAVFASMGFYAYAGVPSSLIILEVVPFLVLAIGADNLFILVLQYQRDERRAEEGTEEQIGRVLGDVAPSMLLCSISESICFFLGALTKMPAVRSFALYAALAILFDFLLQISAFVALMSLDVKREEKNRFDICCCVRAKVGKRKKRNEGFLLPLMREYYAPFLLHPVTRIIVIILFIFMVCAAIFLMLHVQVGLDQELSLPKGSYMLDYFAALNKYFEVGVPVYFVTTAGYNFSTIDGMNGVCSSVGCDNNSMTQKIQYATEFPQVSYMAIPASSWVDDFIDWLNPISRCCRLFVTGPNAGEFCPATNNQLNCRKTCMASNQNGIIRPDIEKFNLYLPRFLNDIPTLQCSKGGLGAYGNAVKRDPNGAILASRFMAYHTPLKNSQEYTAALKIAREIAANITESMREVPGTHPNFEVFPYTITYVYYEQYLTIVNEGLFNIGLCLIPTFVVCCILLGMDIHSGFLNLITIVMIIVDTVGVMTLWDIPYNAVSLINLVTAVGISVEFVSHLTRSFAMSTKENKVQRAKEATYTMGSAVFAGVAMTNLPGIIVLYFAQSQLIQVFFFRLNLVITLLGLVHGLVFLPVLLSYFGPGINSAAFLQREITKDPLADKADVDGCFHNFGYKGSVDHSTTQCNGSAPTEEDTVPRDRDASLEKGSDSAGNCTDAVTSC
ncbi:NPC1-like intracellular cholesterol transporter 1 [Stegostoma tigrinum]|uniref:NPC1-like intracellular cholesterol transporter 1 n=1 Tax=Stegostoma tigrinum TaxID=3053191 RepID=UPI00286FB95C|nr:NPC1-like intracellular cholesterol transporter 1 [Stegostoma tigrinum]XP_059499855.1 NPC1-like intracellular cholesterol transporter 1 [Stegostoma tigrinum]XP_059499856.1 NPC1-like intracellular cholesterol transporter 1 [Stegostoma tigrinum]XP_059499857.1 NPC1-like intracellular cholesterol transporter 1 [Stegostoma tigrinum]XP_059499858.1 NPC1-like intracellular cholesterol transporter 1 [Stegostoma tigrinum]XP_059499859.1 NPC1-like intracellular cholesterol transporter 1 [Stegostoma tig